MPSLVQRIVTEHVHDISDKDLHVMLDDCKDQAQRNNYGDAHIDKQGWLNLRDYLIAEIESRGKGSDSK